MSKSLKNFTSIRSALEQPEWNARALRISFLLGLWSDGIEIGDDVLKLTASWEGKFNNFFLKAMDLQSAPYSANSDSADSKALSTAFEKAKQEFDVAMCDSFNTPVAMRVLSDLVVEVNSVNTAAAPTETLAIAKWLTQMVTVLGLNPRSDQQEAPLIGWSGLEIPEESKDYVLPASTLRDQVRASARSQTLDYDAITKAASTEVQAPDGSNRYAQILKQFQTDVKRLADAQAPKSELLSLCDALRDTHLWNLNIYLEDRDTAGNPTALVRPLDRGLIQARAEQESLAHAKIKAKAEMEAKKQEQEKALAEKAKVSPEVMFRTEEFKEWDEMGVPTIDAKGDEVSKSRRKKLVKEWEKQKKLHEEWKASQE